MLTPWHGQVSHITCTLWKNPTVTGRFLPKEELMQSFDILFNDRLHDRWRISQVRHIKTSVTSLQCISYEIPNNSLEVDMKLTWICYELCLYSIRIHCEIQCIACILYEIAWTSYKTLTLCSCKLYQGLYSLSGKASYRHISPSLEASRLDVIMAVSL